MSPTRHSYRERSKINTFVRKPVFIDDAIEIDVRTRLRRQAAIEIRSKLTSGFTGLISFERTLNYVGNRAIFASRELVG